MGDQWHFAKTTAGKCTSWKENFFPQLASERYATGTEYHVDMSRICPQCLDADCSDRSARSDVLLREEPDEEEDDEEDEGNVTDDEDDGGYSVRMCRLCQW